MVVSVVVQEPHATIAAQLRERGLRATGSRIALYEAVTGLGGHPDVGEITRKAGETGAVSIQGVYDGLAALTEAGLLRRIEPAGSPARYETRVGDNHHHVVCRVCGLTEDVDCAAGETHCLDSSHARGFAVDEAEVTFWGICPDCQSAANLEQAKTSN